MAIRPRPYQLVPLLMALRLHPVRLLIADDVGVGKTIEASLVLRELLDSKEARRAAILVPPHLLEQWVYELREKFALEAVPISSATLARLERNLPPGVSVYQHYPVQVISIDFVKHPRHKHLFLQSSPDLVVVDEAHGAVGGPRQENQMRYELVKALAEDRTRHLLLLTATPHSGIPDAFQRLLGLLDPEFGRWNLEALGEEERARLARHFVLRTRRDVLETWEGTQLFPERIPREVTYTLSQPYLELYKKAYDYAQKLVRAGEALGESQRRYRWWAALALLRAVMSSPRAAQTALERRVDRQARVETGEAFPRQGDEDYLEAFAPQVYEDSQLLPDDEVPTPLFQVAERVGFKEEPLRALRRLVQALTPEVDHKLQGLIRQVRKLLDEGHEPVVWCHYVDTAEYVAEELRKALPNVHVAAVTGRMDGDLRREAIAELMQQSPRVLVATDCVSEGINLQSGFSAVVHYDLPWNPNRLEQREGRVDRYGQPKPQVVAVRYYGEDNPMDRAVLDVLLRKAKEIRNALGVHVPVPQEEAYVVDRMVKRLFYTEGLQPLLLLGGGEAERAWEMDAERERKTRTRFAQRALKPQAVLEALGETDTLLGDPAQVQRFVERSLQLLDLTPKRGEADGVYILPLKAWKGDLELRGLGFAAELLKTAFPHGDKEVKVAFIDPIPEGAVFVGRTHPLVMGLARFVFEGALRKGKASEPQRVLGRYSAIRSRAVKRVTYLYTLRPRYLLSLSRDRDEILGEEVLTFAFSEGAFQEGEVVRQLSELVSEGDPAPYEVRQHLTRALKLWQELQEEVTQLLRARAQRIQDAHKRVRQEASLKVRDVRVTPVGSPDLLGVMIVLPMVG
ncbi:MAG: helicase-related protein [Thermus sp.]|nr:helicase-related protein [Thermus sp.]